MAQKKESKKETNPKKSKETISKPKSNRGRKSKYEEVVKPHIEEIRRWCADSGATEKDICDTLGIAVSTFNEYKNKYPELMEALKKGRKELVLEIKGSLAKKARGYDYEEKKTYIKKDDNGNDVKYTEVTTKHQPPSEAAANMLLKNYDKDWKDNPAMYELKKTELELKKQLAEMNNWE